MNNIIAKSYWRSIQRGVRTLADVPETLRDTVKGLARADVECGLLDADAYRDIVGEDYEAQTDADP